MLAAVALLLLAPIDPPAANRAFAIAVLALTAISLLVIYPLDFPWWRLLGRI